MIVQLKTEFTEQINNCKNLSDLEQVRLVFLGRKEGKLNSLLKGIKDLPDEEKKAAGQEANDLRKYIEKEIKNKEQEFKSENFKKELESEWIDATQPILNGREIGHLHPLTQIQNEIEDIFTSMGFMILDGPELESEYYNFEALNIPSWHPARDMQDTFYVENQKEEATPPPTPSSERRGIPHLLMRTHTSPVQVRAMRQYGAPIKAIVPGRVFRYEASDARHDAAFNQVEGFMIGQDISISNLTAISKTFLDKIFKGDIKYRFRPGYFPFVEPGVEVDLECRICGGRGCRVCKGTGWLEFMGAGMIHPNVLKHGGVNPDKYSGFAFGFGITRLVMMKYEIDDIRLLLNGDLRFLKQF